MRARLSLAVGLFGVILPFGMAEETRTPPQPIIDVHLHAHAADRFGGKGPPNPLTGKPSAAVTDASLLRAVLEAMDRHNIVLGVASSTRSSVERWRTTAPGRFLGGAQIDVGIPFPDLSVLRDDIRAGRVMVLGEIGAQYLGLTPSASAFEPYYALAEELDVPVGIHTGLGPPSAPYECCPKFRAGLGSPLLVEDALVRHPRLRVYLMHAGYPWLSETIALMHEYPQVYADVAVINWVIPRDEFHAYLRALMRAGFGKRLMFGSDQMVWPEAIDAAIEGVESASFLSDSEKRDIFYNNAFRFLRLGSRPVPSGGEPGR